MITGDTIAAISTTTAPAARIILRVSGPAAHRLVGGIFFPTIEHPSTTRARVDRGEVRFAGLVCPAMVLRFFAPRSYSGEDLVEFHLPGNPILATMLLAELIARGARQAEAGEFTARAYFNGRLDLTAAEGVAATISASHAAELTAARKLLAGELARRVRPIIDAVADILALVEAGIDFTEEDISFITRDELNRRLQIAGEIDRLLDESARFERISHEPTVVLVGRPNLGKSTLLNALAGQARAVVSPVAGTTRDAIWAHVRLRRGVVKMIDVAGLDAQQPGPADHSPQADIARQMHARAQQTIASADVVVLVRSLADDADADPLFPRAQHLNVFTKSDLPSKRPVGVANAVRVSAVTGDGMDTLRQRLNDLAFGSGDGPTDLALNARHVAELQAAKASLRSAMAANRQERGAEVVAHDLRTALDHMGRILGAVSPDDILGRIFAGFCIGK